MFKEQCISCGAVDVPLFSIPGAFMPDSRKVCGSCKSRYDGAYRDGAKLRSPGQAQLAAEADRLMLEYHKDEFHCSGCGEPVVMTHKGEVPMYCQRCLNGIFAQYLSFRK